MAENTFHSISFPGVDTARVPDMAVEFSTATSYAVKDYCTYRGVLYRCTTAHAGAWNASHFTATNLDTEFDRKLDIPASQDGAPSNPRIGDLWIDTGVNSPIYNVDSTPTAGSTNAVTSGGVKTYVDGIAAQKSNKSFFCDDYSSTSTYTIDQLVVYEQQLYRCTTSIITPEAWNSSHWQVTNLNTELDRLRNLINS